MFFINCFQSTLKGFDINNLLTQVHLNILNYTQLPSYKPIWKEGNVLFNDALNTFYLRLYGIRHQVKDHSDSEKGNLLPPHRLLFPISSKGSFICINPTDRITHTTAFITPVVEHWLE